MSWEKPAADGMTYQQAEEGGVTGWWCRPGDAVARAAILYLHGGAYIAGAARAYHSWQDRPTFSAKPSELAAVTPPVHVIPEDNINVPPVPIGPAVKMRVNLQRLFLQAV